MQSQMGGSLLMMMNQEFCERDDHELLSTIISAFAWDPRKITLSHRSIITQRQIMFCEITWNITVCDLQQNITEKHLLLN
jgi:hypothetical protein